MGRRFDYVSANIDLAIEGRLELCEFMLYEMAELAKKIESHSAKTLNGLRVKARVAAWALMGDLDANRDCALADDMRNPFSAISFAILTLVLKDQVQCG